MKTPQEWRKLKKTRLSWFEAASVIYRWADHVYHYGPTFQLSEKDYDSAITHLSPNNYHEPAMAKGN